MEQANARVQDAVNTMIDDIDKSCLRKLQIKMFKCSTACCEDMTASVHQVQECVSRCNKPSERADQVLQSELQAFQGRMQRCAMDCQDNAKDLLGLHPSEKEKMKATSTMETCVLKCVDSHISMMPNLAKRIKEAINQL